MHTGELDGVAVGSGTGRDGTVAPADSDSDGETAGGRGSRAGPARRGVTGRLLLCGVGWRRLRAWGVAGVAAAGRIVVPWPPRGAGPGSAGRIITAVRAATVPVAAAAAIPAAVAATT